MAQKPTGTDPPGRPKGTDMQATSTTQYKDTMSIEDLEATIEQLETDIDTAADNHDEEAWDDLCEELDDAQDELDRLVSR